MACIYEVKEDGKIVRCNEPETIPGYCYDHVKLCTECREEPANPETLLCEQCKRNQYTL